MPTFDKLVAFLQAKCKERFSIIEHWIEDGTQGLHWCKVEFIQDVPAADPAALIRNTDTCRQLVDEFLRQCGEAARAEIDSTYGKQPQDPEVLVYFVSNLIILLVIDSIISQRLSFWLSSILPVPYERKQVPFRLVIKIFF